MSTTHPLPLDAAARDFTPISADEAQAFLAHARKDFTSEDNELGYVPVQPCDLERLSLTILALLASVRGAEADTARLDWLETMLNIGSDPVEVFFAGLRSDINLMRPDAKQIEVESASKTYRRVHQGNDLRAALDAARAHPPIQETDNA